MGTGSQLNSSILTLSQRLGRVQIGMEVARTLNQEMIQILDTIAREGERPAVLRSEWDLLDSGEGYVPGDNEDGEC